MFLITQVALSSVALLVNSKVKNKTNSSVDPLHMAIDFVHSYTDDSDSRKMPQSLLRKKPDGRKVDTYGTVFGDNTS